MSVVVVGGNDRMAARYKDICKAYNCKAKVFTQISADFEKQIGSPDLVVVFTNTCSHKMLIGVKHQAKKHNFAIENVHSSGVSALKFTLEKYCE